MPKRRVYKRDSKGRFAKTGVKKKGVPEGKNVLMVHFTSGKNASKILREQRFRPHPDQANVNHVFFTKHRNRNDPQFRGKFGYGYAGVKVSVPRKALKRDTDWPNPKSFMVDNDALTGRKIERLGRG